MAIARLETTTDPANIALFADLAADWWNPEGQSRLLHRINPVRLAFIRDCAANHFRRSPRDRRPLAGLRALDIGCGAGLVAEPLARMGANVTGIDAGTAVIDAARTHAATQGLSIDYHAGEVVDFSSSSSARFDLVTCLEVLEHVTDRPRFLAAIRALLKPDGLLVFSTPNRTPLSWAVMIAGAERIARLIPQGGHDWQQFLTPDELVELMRDAGLHVGHQAGLSWSPLRGFAIGGNKAVNTIGWATPA